MKLEEIIGRNVARLRNGKGWSQPELGERIGRELGKGWSTASVSAAENGNRAFAASDLVVLSYVLGAGLNDLLWIPVDVSSITAGQRTFELHELIGNDWWRGMIAPQQSDDLLELVDSAKMEMQRLSIKNHELSSSAGAYAHYLDERVQSALDGRENKGENNG